MQTDKPTDQLRMLFRETKLGVIMSAPLTTVSEEDDLYEVYSKFSAYKIKHLIVVDGSRHIKGVITLRDLYSVKAPKRALDGSFFYNYEDLDKFILARVMTKNPATFLATDNLGDAIVKMGEKGYGCIPIVDDQQVVIGIITQSDIIKAVARTLKNLP